MQDSHDQQARCILGATCMIARFWNWIDDRYIVRRLVLIGTFVTTIWAIREAFIFATSSPFDGGGTAAVIAAILAPLSVLQGFAFRDYNSGRGEKG